MAHVAKYSKGAVGHMANHYGRSDAKGKAACVVRSNQEIKPELTHLNYNLAKEYQPMEQVSFVKKRLSEVKVQKRADVNILCDWVVTAPKDLPEKELKPFFEATHAFLAGKYGKENVMSAYVHMDETTPHLHFAFIPVVPDYKRGGYKVSAKECITRAQLKIFHNELQERLENELGHSVSILNEATKDGNKSISDLKRGTAVEKVAKMHSEASQTLSEAQKEAQDIKDSLIPLKAEYGAKRAFLDEIKKDFDLTKAKENKTLFGKIKSYTVPKDVWETQVVTKMETSASKQAQAKWEQEMEKLSETSILAKNKSLSWQVKQLKQENAEWKHKASEHSFQNYAIKQENVLLKKELEEQEKDFVKKLNRVLEKMPPDMAKIFVDFWNRQKAIEKQKNFDMDLER